MSGEKACGASNTLKSTEKVQVKNKYGWTTKNFWLQFLATYHVVVSGFLKMI